MVDSTITDLPAAAALAGTEPVPVDQAGATVRATVQAIADLALTELGTAAVADTGTSGHAVPFLDAANTWSGDQSFAYGTLNINDTDNSHHLGIRWNEDATAGRNLNLLVHDAVRNIDLSGNLTLSGYLATAGGFGITLTGTAVTSVTLPVSGTLATTADIAGKADTVHTHVIADTTGLQAALDLKAPLASPALTGTPTVPTASAATSTTQAASTAFVQGHVTTLNTAISGKAATVHTHVITDTTGLQTALDGKAASTHTHAESDITGLTAALDAAVLVAGDTMTGALTLSAAPTADLHAATKKYVDDSVTAGGGYTDEQVQDVVATMIQPGTGITWSYNDVAGTLTPTVTGGGGDVSSTRLLTAGAGLTGGGDLSADRTFTVGAGTGITVGTDDVGLTVPVTAVNGGTGQTSYAVGDLLYAGTTTTLAKLAGIATGNALISGGVSTAPSWGKVALTTHVSGTLPVGNGGTNITSYAVGDIIYASAATTLAKLPDVATGNVLLSGGVTTAPAYGKVGLTTHVTGVLPVANGGTGTGSAHTHVMTDVTDLAAALALKATVDDPTFTGSMLFTGGAFEPASLSSDQNDYFPDSADRRAIWGLTSSANVTLTGIDGTSSNGRHLYLVNLNSAGGFCITLKSESASSSAGNRFLLGSDVVLYPGEGATLLRITSRWRLFSPHTPRSLVIAVSDETTALSTGTAKTTFRMPYMMKLTAVRASLTTAQTSGSTLTIDINEGGTSVLSTKLTIDNTEKTSTTAAAAAVISDALLADDAEMTVDIDTVGDGTAKGLKITLIG